MIVGRAVIDVARTRRRRPGPPTRYCALCDTVGEHEHLIAWTIRDLVSHRSFGEILCGPLKPFGTALFIVQRNKLVCIVKPTPNIKSQPHPPCLTEIMRRIRKKMRFTGKRLARHHLTFKTSYLACAQLIPVPCL